MNIWKKFPSTIVPTFCQERLVSWWIILFEYPWNLVGHDFYFLQSKNSVKTPICYSLVSTKNFDLFRKVPLRMIWRNWMPVKKSFYSKLLSHFQIKVSNIVDDNGMDSSKHGNFKFILGTRTNILIGLTIGTMLKEIGDLRPSAIFSKAGKSRQRFVDKMKLLKKLLSRKRKRPKKLNQKPRTGPSIFRGSMM